jgi:mRNA-degrading endonuclease RelE of RelBE toxin-antitoxin system
LNISGIYHKLSSLGKQNPKNLLQEEHLKTIERQLGFEPDVETKNRKPLKHPTAFETAWEIRFGPDNRFRVFYEVDQETHKVFILAAGQKKGNRLLIAGEEFDL